MLKSSITALAIVLSVPLSACGGGETTVHSTSVSKGQQLTDLKDALDRGAITEKEYEAQRKKILNGPN